MKSIKLKIIAGVSDGFSGGIYLEREYVAVIMNSTVKGEYLPHRGNNYSADINYSITSPFCMMKNIFRLDFNKTGYNDITMTTLENTQVSFDLFKVFNESRNTNEIIKIYFYKYNAADGITSSEGLYYEDF